jgi:uncharacterized Zn finger protein (UPF0148 family)
MKVRGERECKECATRWSYYETGSVTCPECDSLHSVGVDERTEHTANASDLDLTAVRDTLDEAPLREVATDAASICREYVRRHGFVDAGTLLPLDETYVAATELQHAGEALGRRMRVDDDEKLYFLALLRGADRSERPPPAEVPESLRAARGLAIATTIESYHRDVKRVIDYSEQVTGVLSRLRDHRKRIEALDGDVPVGESEQLLAATQDLSRYLTAEDETAFARAVDRLDSLD